MADITSLPAAPCALRVSSQSAHDAQAARAYQGLFLLCFVFVLLIALIAQALFVDWRSWFPGAESEKSLFKGVRAAVYTFMSYLN